MITFINQNKLIVNKKYTLLFLSNTIELKTINLIYILRLHLSINTFTPNIKKIIIKIQDGLSLIFINLLLGIRGNSLRFILKSIGNRMSSLSNLANISLIFQFCNIKLYVGYFSNRFVSMHTHFHNIILTRIR